MPTLYEMCVWTLPFPPAEIYMFNTEGSPNVFFTTECSDCMAPEITAVDSLYQPEYIEVSSTEDGMIYLVPENTGRDLESILADSIKSVSANANVVVNISLEDLDNGIYWLYATDLGGNISESHSFTILGVGINNITTDQLRIYPNPTADLLNIESAQLRQYSIEITSLNGQLMYNSEMVGTSHQIDLSSFQKGIYFITIRSMDFVTTEKIIKL